MKYIGPLLILLSSQLFADDRAFDLYFKINYHTTFNQEKNQTDNYIAPFNQGLATRFQLQADLTDESELNIELNPLADRSAYSHCKGIDYVNEARVSYYINDTFSFDLGCLKQNRGGFNTAEVSNLSYFDTDKMGLLYDYLRQSRFTPAFNFHFDVFGAFTLQVTRREGQNIPGFNLKWTMSLLGIEPLFEIGLYGDNMKSLHYSAGLKAEFEQVTIRGGYFSDNNGEEKKSLSSWELFAYYENSSWIQPYVRVYYVKTQENDIDKDKFFTFSFGNKMEFGDSVEPYISFNLKRDDKTYANDFDVRLGVAATI